MTPTQKKLKNGTSVWYLRLYDKKTGKRPYMLDERGDILQFKSKAEAQDFIKSEKARKAAARTLVLKKKLDESQFHSIQALVESFLPKYKERAPNSHERAEQYFRDYILPFFLIKKGTANIEEWGDLLEDFKDYLACVRPKKGNKSTLAKSTQNHVFVVLFLFSEFAVKKKKLTRPFHIERYPQKQLNRRTVEAVVPESESNKIIKTISKTWEDTTQNRQFLIYYRLLLHSGMRLSEGLGLALGSYVDSPLKPGHPLAKALRAHNIKSYGYIILKSQLHRGNIKPLKSKEEGDSRIIPITDKDLKAQLDDLFKKAVDYWQAEDANEKYFAFYELSPTLVNTLLKKVYEDIKMPPRTFHQLRHTFTTRLVERTFDTLLTKTITGHSSKAFERYLHIAKKMEQEAESSVENLGYFKKRH